MGNGRIHKSSAPERVAFTPFAALRVCEGAVISSSRAVPLSYEFDVCPWLLLLPVFLESFVVEKTYHDCFLCCSSDALIHNTAHLPILPSNEFGSYEVLPYRKSVFQHPIVSFVVMKVRNKRRPYVSYKVVGQDHMDIT